MSAKIVNLDIQNVMRIKAVSIKPDGGVVILGGRNAQGKTSVLDSIAMAIGGRRLCPDMPIREGENSAEIKLELGGLTITRSFEAKDGGYTSKLTVKNAEGQPLARPQELLDDLVGRLAFDPLEFARMKPTDARETLRALVGLDVEQLEEEMGNVYREREEAGRAKRAAQAVVDDMPVPRAPELILPTASITEEMAQCARRQADFEELRGVLRHSESNLSGLERRRADLAEERDLIGVRIDDNARSIDQAEVIIEQAQFAVENFVNTDADEIKGRLDALLARNENATAIGRARERYGEKETEALAAAETWKGLDQKHGDLFHEIKKRTEAVTYPIPDLELRKEGVFYQGVPFEQGSRAERIKVSMAMGVAMNKELGILLIRDGSVLDTDSMEMISALAEKNDMQFWVEMARGYEGAAGAIIIEDGEVAA